MHETLVGLGPSTPVDYQRFGELSIPNTTTRLPVYVHIPFCSKHCWYCDFNVYERMGGSSIRTATRLFGRLRTPREFSKTVRASGLSMWVAVPRRSSVRSC